MGLVWKGLEGISPLFCSFSSLFFVFLRFSLFFVVFLRFSPHAPRTRANNCNLREKWGFHSDPV